MDFLSKFNAGKWVRIKSLSGGMSAERRLLDMGLVPGEHIKIVNNSGFGPVTILVKEAKIAIGQGLAKKIIVEEVINDDK